MGMKKAKLVEQFTMQAKGEEKEEGIFSGVSIFVNGWTKPSSDELKRLMMSHGGIYHHYYNSAKTTHIIASNLPDVKIKRLKGHELIVKPEWITACLAASRLVDYKPYLLFNHQSKNQPVIPFQPIREDRTESENSVDDQPINQTVLQDDNSSPELSHKTIQSANQSLDCSPNKAKDSKDPRFMGEFFQNSRLHHISTMGSNAKEYVSSLREKHDGIFPARDALNDLVGSDPNPEKTIMHIDMDCFFVSVGLRSRPHLVGKPVAVAHAKGNKQSRGHDQDKLDTQRRKNELLRYQEKLNQKSGLAPTDPRSSSMSWKLDNIDGLSSFSELASCSYEAREAGVKNGMFLGPALKLCPDLQTIPYDFPGYEEVSNILYDTVASYSLEIQAVSCDEMFVNLTPLLRQLKMSALRLVSHLRAEIRAKTGCACSVGLGPNIFLARMATKKAKPDGQYHLQESNCMSVLAELSVLELPGVGRSLNGKLKSLSIETCSDLHKLTLGQLQREVGNKIGKQLYNFCRGIDERKLELEQVRKTVGAEVNYGIRFTGWEDARQFLLQLAGEVSERLERLGTRGRCITLKLMLRAQNAPEETSKFLGHGVCDNSSKSVQLGSSTADKDRIFKEVHTLLKQTEAAPSDIRGIGISVSKLEERKINPGRNSLLKFVKKTLDTTQNKQSLSPEPEKTKDKTQNKQLLSPEPEKEKKIGLDTNVSYIGQTNNIISTAQDQGIYEGSSVHELDPQVLAALPEDIRNEVLAQYNIKPKDGVVKPTPRYTNKPIDVSNETSSYRNTPHAELATSQEPGPSHGRKNVPQPKRKKTIVESESNSISDMSFSQIDEGVLQELPDELREEITAHFQDIKRTVEAKSIDESVFSTLMRNSPKKKSSPEKAGKKRGRPKKNGAPPANKGSSSRITVPSASKSVLTTSKTFINSQENPTSNETSTESRDSLEKIEATFCGKSRLEDIRPLVKEWLASTNFPFDEDISLMSDFLEALVFAKKIHLVSILITCIQRNILKLEDSEGWKKGFGNLVTKVQTRMMECYGNPLAVSKVF